MQRRQFLISSAAAVAATLPFAGASPSADAKRGQRIAPKPQSKAHNLPNVVLRTQDDKPVRLYEDLLQGKIFLINTFFVTCTDGACPVATANLAKVQPLIGPRLGRDIFMYSLTLDPQRDTPASLKAYSALFRPKPGWLFLTGDAPDIDCLRRALGYWDPDPERDADKTNHAGMAMIGNESLDRWTTCPTRAEPREIARVLSYVDWPKDWTGRSVHRPA